MEIFGTDNNLDAFLRSVKNQRIDIAVAFASKTEAVIESLIANGNEVHLTVGTINCFSDPVFFRKCQEIASNNQKLHLAIDFRCDNSIHWKVYLISPNTVIVGSSNLTIIGLSMSRDTAVMVKSSRLYEEYMKSFSNLRKNTEVLAWNDERFEEFLSDYEIQHHKRSPIRNIPQGKTLSFIEWLRREESQSLSLFLWDRDFTPEEKLEFKEQIVPILKPEDIGTANTSHYPIGILDKKPNYNEGDWLLCASCRGASPGFHFLHTIQHYQKRWWLCGIRKRRQKPFSVRPDKDLREALKKLASNWLGKGKTLLNSNDLEDLANAMRPNQ